ncbi:uncharacterized protein LOC107806484 [Nicotiana tabacum]|uniref:Uncharacterized protein LOC107806484 n=1 Tax=Nicotiana tabacum TaxID=4097 RepID=A0AC58TL20_TOBAC
MLFKEEPTIDNIIVLQNAQAELKKYLSIEEQYRKQKAGVIWVAEGDRNTNFFHNHVNGKKKKLQVKRIHNGDGGLVEDHDQIANVAVNFYQKRFSKETDHTDFSLLNNVPYMVTMERNLDICRYPTLEEVKGVVFELSGDIGSVPDGFNGLSTKSVGRSFVMTYIAWVSWKYLLHVLRNMGFAEHFITMVWNLLSNNWYLVLVNGQSSDFSKSTRGVKQGDPLSPTLFILSAEVLSRSLNKFFEDSSFIGFGRPKWTDPLNHLAYADDTIIFALAHQDSLMKLMVVLVNYEKISGQLINKSKSSYYMHANVANSLFQEVGDATRFAKGEFPFTYLGCPIFYTRRSKDYYEALIKKVKAKRHSWKGKLLSYGSKATLITSVL